MKKILNPVFILTLVVAMISNSAQVVDKNSLLTGQVEQQWRLFKEHRYKAVQTWLDAQDLDNLTGTEGAAWTWYLKRRMEILREDFSEISALMKEPQKPVNSIRGFGDNYAMGRLAFRQFRYDKADSLYLRACELTDNQLLKAEAELGRVDILQRRQQYQEAYDLLVETKDKGGASDDLLYELATTMIRLGRVNEAIEHAKHALEVNPYNQMAHYYLGNGYATQNYTELVEAYPQCFPDLSAYPVIDSLKSNVDPAEFNRFRREVEAVIDRHPEALFPRMILAEAAWLNDEFERTEELCFEALKICPDYGRAHSILARVFEAWEMRMNIHYYEDGEEFKQAATPNVPGIEQYVVNWEKLSPRHQKRVALSVEPWKRFIPTMAATGHSHYIKPMREKLSECPNMETLKDHRINLDSRLWDDVRGAGGYHTITGIEDVERTIYREYNTVLHELTHQVHGLLTDPEKKLIEDAYMDGKTREAAGEKVFLTRYQASTVWEYFAEGINSYYSLRRDEFDDRELVRERLLEMDPQLVELVEHFTTVTEMQPYIVIGKVRAANELVERGRAEEALAQVTELTETNGDDRAVLHAQSWISNIVGNNDDAIRSARRTVELYPHEVEGYLNLANAIMHARRGAAEALTMLEKAYNQGQLDFPHRICMKLGELNHFTGNYRKAADWYEVTLEYQDDLPQAIWGLALAWGESSHTRDIDPEHFSRSNELFLKVIPERSGLTPLRLDYARILMMNGDEKLAQLQIDEAYNLTPDDPMVWTYQAWLYLNKGNLDEANALLNKALASDSTLDLANILVISQNSIESRREYLAEIKQTVPTYIYVPLKAEYEQRGIIPMWQKELLLRGI